MIEPIPIVKLNDKASWIENKTIAVSAFDLIKHGKRLSQFKKKKIIVLSIIPDFFDDSYRKLLDNGLKEIKERENLILTSSNCTIYTDKPEWGKEELEDMFEDNNELFENYKIKIGVLKGYNTESYERTRKSLEKYVQAYLLCITEENRNNPRYFSLLNFIQNNFPEGLDKPLYLQGCTLKQMKAIPRLNIKIKGIITSGHLIDSVFRDHRKIKRATRITQSWSKWSQAIRNA